jgi:hypothetical protein
MSRRARVGIATLGGALGCAIGGQALHAAPALVLPARTGNATLTLEADVSRGKAVDVVSVPPDLSFGVTDTLTLVLAHSTIARTGLRGSVGAGPCVTEACSGAYDNVGIEALYSVVADGAVLVAANPGIHAWSFANDHYVAKLGARLRTQVAGLTITALPAVTLAITARDGTPPNRDRLWLPVVAFYPVAPGLSLGIGTGFKAPLDDIAGAFEIPAGLLAQYAISPALGLGASWVHGKSIGGDAVMDTGLATRALNVWLSVTN